MLQCSQVGLAEKVRHTATYTENVQTYCVVARQPHQAQALASSHRELQYHNAHSGSVVCTPTQAPELAWRMHAHL